MRWAIILFLSTVYFVAGCPADLAGQDIPYVIRTLEYHFYHANIFHLAVNCIAVYSIFNPKWGTHNGRDLLAAFIIASAVYPLTFHPVIGFSNILYATIGMRTPPLNSKWWRTPQTLTFLIVTILMVFIPQFSATTHIFAMTAGVLLAHLRRK